MNYVWAGYAVSLGGLAAYTYWLLRRGRAVRRAASRPSSDARR